MRLKATTTISGIRGAVRTDPGRGPDGAGAGGPGGVGGSPRRRPIFSCLRGRTDGVGRVHRREGRLDLGSPDLRVRMTCVRCGVGVWGMVNQMKRYPPGGANHPSADFCSPASGRVGASSLSHKACISMPVSATRAAPSTCSSETNTDLPLTCPVTLAAHCLHQLSCLVEACSPSALTMPVASSMRRTASASARG